MAPVFRATWLMRDNALWRWDMARRKRYSPEFKRQALRRANVPGVTDALVCEELGVSTRQLRRWREAIQEHGESNATEMDVIGEIPQDIDGVYVRNTENQSGRV